MGSRKYWIALAGAHGAGPALLRDVHQALVRLGISITDAFDLTQSELERELELSPAGAAVVHGARARLDAVESEYFALLDAGVEIVLFFEESYPQRLTTVLGGHLPPVLYCYGNRALLNQKAAAVLGEKQASEKGEMIAYLAAKELAAHQVVVVSGFARGIDLIAHRGALENGGTTVAVLPYGFSHLAVPESLRDVLNPDALLLVSPFEFEREYTQFNAMKRNKLACALSRAVYIVEAPAEGGIFEAGKSARTLGVPLYVTEYSEYPASAAGNPALMSEYAAIPVRGRVAGGVLSPNLDRLLGDVKFS